jgi:hypothetical protein
MCTGYEINLDIVIIEVLLIKINWVKLSFMIVL